MVASQIFMTITIVVYLITIVAVGVGIVCLATSEPSDEIIKEFGAVNGAK